MKTDKITLGKAFALAGGIYYTGCYIFALIAPRFFLNISASWFHMVDLGKIGQITIADPGSFLLGLVSFTINAWFIGVLLGWSIELFSRKK